MHPEVCKANMKIKLAAAPFYMQPNYYLKFDYYVQ